jgi:hypothetical protein
MIVVINGIVMQSDVSGSMSTKRTGTKAPFNHLGRSEPRALELVTRICAGPSSRARRIAVMITNGGPDTVLL